MHDTNIYQTVVAVSSDGSGSSAFRLYNSRYLLEQH